MTQYNQYVLEQCGEYGVVEAAKDFSAPPAPKLTDREREIMKLMAAPSHVYFIYSAGLVKIGYSTNWKARVDQVCQGCPEHAELILVMTGDRKMERGYHALFGDYHQNGEWFQCKGKMREFLIRLASEQGREALEMAEQAHMEMPQ